jgi:glycosyltransferase involved in cell wall biosynthesis
MTARPKPRVCILSSVHQALDNRIFYKEAQSLKNNGYQVRIIAVHDHTEAIGGIEVIGLRRVYRWQRPLLWITILKHALNTNADIYHFHDLELLLITPILRILSRKPIIYDVHEVNADFMEIKSELPHYFRITIAWLLRVFEPILARLQSGLIFADDEIAANFKKINLPKTTIFNYPLRSFVDNGISETSNNDPRNPIIIYLGSIKQERGSWLMIEAFRQVIEQIPEAKLSLVGPFTPKNHELEIKFELDQQGLKHAVIITGPVQFIEIGKYLKQAAAGWIPWPDYAKHRKNIPTKVFEYMSYRVPVVSSDLPSVRPFITHGVDGFLVEPNDPAAHAKAIINLLNQPKIAIKMGQRGQETVKNKYSWDSMEIRLLNLYQEVLGDKQKDYS